MENGLSAYRLYTVVPRLLGMIDNLTNWYIRFNRKRLKGEFGLSATRQALNTLFEVLFILVRGLAPFMPFLTDHIYQHLAPHIPKHLQPKDPRSVHLHPFPEVREELFDEEVERKVARMQAVIELARLARERKGIGLKTPLKTLIVIHPDPIYLDDVRSLRGYICEELNVRDLELSSDEEKYHVRLRVTADWPTLGKKLRKEAQTIKKRLPDLTNEQIRQFLQDGEMSIDGIRLERDDLVVQRSVGEEELAKGLEAHTDNDVLIILDSQLHPELAQEGLARDLISRVQKLRKKAGLLPTADVRMQYQVVSEPAPAQLEGVIRDQAALIQKSLRGPLEACRVNSTDGLIVEEEQEIQSAVVRLRLLQLDDTAATTS